MQLVYCPIPVYLCSVIISVFTYYLHEFTNLLLHLFAICLCAIGTQIICITLLKLSAW